MSWWQIAIGLIGALGVGGYLSNLLDRRHTDREAEKVREHATHEARAQRRWEIRREVYADYAAYLERIRVFANWTEPMIGPMPEPPSIALNDASFQLGGRVIVTASQPLRDAAGEVTTRGHEFMYALDEWRASTEPGYMGKVGESPRKTLEDARQALLDSIDRAEKLMAAELEAI